MGDTLRSTTIHLEFLGQDGIQGIRQFTRAITDTDEAVDELSKELGENTKVTVKNIRTKKELTADARRLVSQMERNKRKVRELTRLYDHQSKSIKKTVNEQEVLNAVYKLGANATQKQKDEVTNLVQKYQQLRDGTNKNQKSFRNMRGVTQNLGFQLQDVAVQAQMGTDAFVIFSQQGSQMAGAFGPIGALIGAGIAIGGVALGILFKTMFTAAEQAKKTRKEVDELVTSIIKLKTAGKGSELDKLIKADIAAERIKGVDESIKTLTKSYERATTAIRIQNAHVKIAEEGSDLKRISEKRLKDAQILARVSKKALDDEIANRDALLAIQNGTTEETVKLSEAVSSLVNSLTKEASEIGKSKLAIDLRVAALGNANEAQLSAIFLAHKAIDAEDERIKQEKIAKKLLADKKREQDKIIAKIFSAFKSEKNSLIKQTESIEEEYTRRKKVIDNFVDHIGKSNDETKAAYLNLQSWRNEQLEKETAKTIAEFNKREAVRRQIEKMQTKQLGGRGGAGVEENLFLNNIKTLNDQKKLLGEEELAEKQRIDNLIEQEILRHESKVKDINDETLKANVAVFAMASNQITAMADMMRNGVREVEEKTSEMNDGQKAAFLFSQAIAATMAFINGVSLGGKLAEMFPLQAPAMITFGTTMGAINAGAILGATIEGAFDKGGNIPSGKLGIVSEFGDELVNGQLIKGPARVTSREDTAKMMGGGGETKIIIENKIEGARFVEQRVDANTVRIIAEQTFSDNIDKGVSGVLNNRNSKTTKSLKSKFAVRGQY